MYNTCIIRFVLRSAQPAASSYNTRSCIVVHMAVYYTLYYTYVLYKLSIVTTHDSRLTTHAIREVRDCVWVMRVMYT
jgi:hypothetical protein